MYGSVDIYQQYNVMFLVRLYSVGVPADSIYENFTNIFILQRSSASTLPFAIDNPASTPTKGKDLNEIVIDLFNKGKSASMRRECTPKSLPIVASNYNLKPEERSAHLTILNFDSIPIWKHNSYCMQYCFVTFC